jgi:hypothetical protein
MKHDCGKEQDGGDDCDTPSQTVTPAGIVLLKVSRKGERDQKSNDEPTVVQADFDAKNASEFDLSPHGKAPSALVECGGLVVHPV